KRLIGRCFDDHTVQTDLMYLPFTIVNRLNQPYICINMCGQQKEYSPEEFMATILLHLKSLAERKLQATIQHVVVSIPSCYTYTQRQATLSACALAEFSFFRLVHEPSAIALSYAHKNPTTLDTTYLLIFHLGGGTFDTSVAAVDEGIVEIVATIGENHLGGEDLDQRLIDHCLAEFNQIHRIDISSDPQALQCLRIACETAKCTLSSTAQSSVAVQYCYKDLEVSLSLTQAFFQQLCYDIFFRTINAVKKVLNNARIERSLINEVILVGGTAQIPCIRDWISGFFPGKRIISDVQQDVGVGQGLAIQAAILSGIIPEHTRKLLLLDIVPHVIEINIGDKWIEVFPANTTVPAQKTYKFATYPWGTPVHIYENSSKLHQLDFFLIPLSEYTIKLDLNGILSIEMCSTTSD
ncbi:heat shock protein 70 family, partial [Favolaschia claudopus]